MMSTASPCLAVPRLAPVAVACTTLCLLASSLFPAVAWGQDNALTIADEASSGHEMGRITLPDGASLPLFRPVVAHDIPYSQRREQMLHMIGKIDADQFTRQSVLAPVMIDTEAIRDEAGVRLAHRVHSAFVVYGKREKLEDERLLQQLLGLAPNPQLPPPGTTPDQESQEVPADVLHELKIPPPASNERYRFVQFPLLNEVKIRGTLRVQQQSGADWLELQWQLDPRFVDAGAYCSRWTKEIRDDLGGSETTAPAPYLGMGGFLSIVALEADGEPLLIEVGMMLHEPDGWFAGENFLRAKLPLAVQESARNFRREIAKLNR